VLQFQFGIEPIPRVNWLGDRSGPIPIRSRSPASGSIKPIRIGSDPDQGANWNSGSFIPTALIPEHVERPGLIFLHSEAPPSAAKLAACGWGGFQTAKPATGHYWPRWGRLSRSAFIRAPDQFRIAFDPANPMPRNSGFELDAPNP